MYSAESDLTGKARVRNAALALFGEDGADAVSVRAVAHEAGVSPGLVIHHYANRDGLITAVNDYVLDRVTTIFAATDLAAGNLKPVSELAQEPHVLSYIARLITEDGEPSRRLFDQFYELCSAFLDSLADNGARPLPDNGAVAAWLLAADIGLLVLRPHLARLGMDPFSEAGLERFVRAEEDLLTTGLQGGATELSASTSQD